jgi:hypothetical protein
MKGEGINVGLKDIWSVLKKPTIDNPLWGISEPTLITDVSEKLQNYFRTKYSGGRSSD